MNKTIVKQVLITFYSDGTSRYSELTRVLPQRDASGRFVRQPRQRPEAKPDLLVTCPTCGTEFRVHRRH